MIRVSHELWYMGSTAHTVRLMLRLLDNTIFHVGKTMKMTMTYTTNLRHYYEDVTAPGRADRLMVVLEGVSNS